MTGIQSLAKLFIMMSLLLGFTISLEAETFELQHRLFPDENYIYDHALIRTDLDLINVPQGNSDLLIGSKTDGGELRSLLEFSLSPLAAELSSATITSVQLHLTFLPTTGGLPRIDGSPKIDVYSYEYDIDQLFSTWNDPDGDGSPNSGDTTPGGTLASYINTYGELDASNFDPLEAGQYHVVTLDSTPAFITAVEDALAGSEVLRLNLIEDSPNFSTRDIAFILGTDTRSSTVLPRLTITTAGSGGDFDSDGDVDGADFLSWQRGETSPPLDATALSDWQSSYGTGGQVPLVRLASVPEPTSGLLLSFALIVACQAPRRRRAVAAQK